MRFESSVVNEFDEASHPRDENGRFASTGESSHQLPPAPGTAPLKPGYIRLYHQTNAANLDSIRKNGLTLSKAKGIEGPKAIYATTTPFYGTAEQYPTIEFQVPAEDSDGPFLRGDHREEVRPSEFIAIHEPWHAHARYAEENPDVRDAILAGEHDDVSKSDHEYAPAIAYIKQKYGKRAANSIPAFAAATEPGAGFRLYRCPHCRMPVNPEVEPEVGMGTIACPVCGEHLTQGELEDAANSQPTDAQKSAGNYEKQKFNWNGLRISIENPKGSERSGVGKDGKPWTCKVGADYGYIRLTEGEDGDHLDCYFGPDEDSDEVFVVHQQDADSKAFDEHKVMLAFKDADHACNAYLKSFSDAKAGARIQKVERMTMDGLKDWIVEQGIALPSFGNAEWDESQHPRSQDGKFAGHQGGSLPRGASESSIPSGAAKIHSIPEKDRNLLADKAYELSRKLAGLSQGSSGRHLNAVDTIESNLEARLQSHGITPMVKGVGEMEDAKDELRNLGYKRAAERGEWDLEKWRPITEEDHQSFRDKQTASPEFKAWFENSKATDKNGNPRVLFHVTTANFSEFKPGGDKPDVSGHAIWLATNPEITLSYHNTGSWNKPKEGTRFIPVFAKVKNPLIIDSTTREWAETVFSDRGKEFPHLIGPVAVRKIKEAGYDGIFDYGRDPNPKYSHLREVIIFDPIQVKSAIGNSGKFDPKDKDIANEFSSLTEPAMANELDSFDNATAPKDKEPKFLKAAREQVAKATAKQFEPVSKRLRVIASIKDPAVRLAEMKRLRRNLPAMLKAMLKPGAQSEAVQKVIATAFVAGLSSGEKTGRRVE